MSHLTLREAARGDSAEITRIVNAAYRPDAGAGGWTHESALVRGARTSAEQVEELLSDSVVLVGLRGSRLVACVQIQGKGNEAHIGMLAVEPSLQGTGAGSVMLARAEAYAAGSLGAAEFVLVVVSARIELIRFYIHRGYEQTKERMAYPLGSGVGTPRIAALDLTVLRKRSRAEG